MKIAIIQFPGTNCERESLAAVRRAGMEPVEFLWNEPYEKLHECDGYFIAGGFSYEDRARAGIIASLDPVMKIIRQEAESGKLVLGVCNGAQVLVETGMVPGTANNALVMALAVNKRMQNGAILGTGFYNGWVNVQLAVPSEANAFTRHITPGQFMRIPVAHGEGRYIIPDELLKEMQERDMTAFRYCDNDGRISEEFPVNPNGAVFNLAAVANTRGNVMAMMPHPERSTAGDPIFTSMREYIEERTPRTATPLSYSPKTRELKQFTPSEGSDELLVDLIITDNEAVSVQNALNHLDIPVTITRQTHWELTGDADLEHIKRSGELYNSNKEKIVAPKNQPNTVSILVRYKDDFVGQAKQDTLTNQLGIGGITGLRKGTIWNITAEDGTIEDVLPRILETHLLFNPFSQDAFRTNASLQMKYEDIIKKNLKNVLTETNLTLGKKLPGKVRDIYELEDKMVFITTDRQSAFDRILAAIPFKGQVLNQTSAWWFERTKHIIPNHVLDVPDPNVTVGKKCTVFPVEFVVRGYITGTTDTSMWMNYEKGSRMYCGHALPEGLTKNQKLEQNLVTPTTKEVEHDRMISAEEIVREGFMTQDDWDFVRAKALELFAFGQKTATEHGLILVDTKYEFGRDADGNILLIDEVHTPDSSRYWIADSYEQRIAAGQEPENIDKEFLRLWFVDNCDPYNDVELPPAPDELVAELSRRYIMLYEMITGQTFEFPNEEPIEERITRNMNKIL